MIPVAQTWSERTSECWVGQEDREPIGRQVVAGLSRRRSLLAAGGAALTAVLAPLTARRPGAGVEATSRGAKKARKRRQAQVAPCRSAILAACTDPGCADRLLPCCEPFATCDAGTALQRIATNSGGN